MKFRNLYCICGPSGVGKTTLADSLSTTLGMKQVASYTTREPRYEGEKEHIFVTPEQFHKLGKMCAYTKRDGVEYGVTEELLDQCQLYVIDPAGIEYLTSRYTNRNVKVIGLYADQTDLRIRMRNRGDSLRDVENRLELDKKEISLDAVMGVSDIVIPTSGPRRVVYETAKAYILGCELEDWIAI